MGMKKEEKGEVMRQDLEKLYGALLRLFRGHHGKKMVRWECLG